MREYYPLLIWATVALLDLGFVLASPAAMNMAACVYVAIRLAIGHVFLFSLAIAIVLEK